MNATAPWFLGEITSSLSGHHDLFRSYYGALHRLTRSTFIKGPTYDLLQEPSEENDHS